MLELMDSPQEQPLLTTDKGKMYDLYILHPNGDVEVLKDESIFDGWYDHCIVPELFKELAEKHKLHYTEQTYDFVVEEYKTNYLGQ